MSYDKRYEHKANVRQDAIKYSTCEEVNYTYAAYLCTWQVDICGETLLLIQTEITIIRAYRYTAKVFFIIFKTDNVPKNTFVKTVKKGLHIEIYQSTKVLTTPMHQQILNSDFYLDVIESMDNDYGSFFFNMTGQVFTQVTAKIWEGSQAKSGWVSFRLNHYGRNGHWIKRFLDFKYILIACRVNALHGFKNIENNALESWLQHGGGPWFGKKLDIFRDITVT